MLCYPLSAVLALAIASRALAQDAPPPPSTPPTAAAPQVDFGYAFGYPHRITVAPPDSGDKTLVDCEPGVVSLSWSYHTLMDFPVENFYGPATEWKVVLRPEVDGQRLTKSSWHRAEGWLPAATIDFPGSPVHATLEIIGAERAALVCAEFTNTDTTQSHVVGIDCSVPGNWRGVNPAGVDPSLPTNARDALVAGWKARSDRVILASVGADDYVISANNLHPVLKLAPGETKHLWLVRPYRVYESMLPELRRRDWAGEFTAAKNIWHELIGRSTRLQIPDEGVRNAYYACLSDVFIMREPVPGDYIGTLPGTEMYRAANPFEAAIASVALDQAGLPLEAADGYRIYFDEQNFDGCWAWSQGWDRTDWIASGFKTWFAMEHYEMTGDRDFLSTVFPHLLASSRWQEQQRRRTRVQSAVHPETLPSTPAPIVSGVSTQPLNAGLLPPGMGDGGLKNGDSLYGVFLPHNIWAVYADQQTMIAAQTLGLTAEAAEIRQDYETARTDLLATIRRGAISENGYQWIPGTAGKTTGSDWGALNALLPCHLLAPDDPLITGTIRHMQSKLSPGGLPMHTGWMENGMWVAITLDNLAEALLARNDGDSAAKYLYATLNHGTPFYSWCEERGPEPGSSQTSGDRQHLWTPVAVLRLLRDSLVFEEGDTLHLARGIDRSWLARGPVGGSGFWTHFGRVAYSLTRDSAAHQVHGHVTLAADRLPASLQVHVRLEAGEKITGVDDPGARVLPDGETVVWSHPTAAEISFNATIGAP